MKKSLAIAVLLVAACSSKAQEGSTPGDCEDTKDNDNDGRYDCEDDGCEMADSCVEFRQQAEKERKAASRLKSSKKEPAKAPEPKVLAPVVDAEGYIIQTGHNGEDITFVDAEEYCKKLKLVNKAGWRLPTTEEALQIIKSDEIVKDSSYVMWTSDKTGKKRAKIVGISEGAVNDLGIYYKGQCRARCVLDTKP
jgi:hypothetical protein